MISGRVDVGESTSLGRSLKIGSMAEVLNIGLDAAVIEAKIGGGRGNKGEAGERG